MLARVNSRQREFLPVSRRSPTQERPCCFIRLLEAMLSSSTTWLHLIHNSPRQGNLPLHLALLSQRCMATTSLPTGPGLSSMWSSFLRKWISIGTRMRAEQLSQWELVLVHCLVLVLKWQNLPVWDGIWGRVMPGGPTTRSKGEASLSENEVQAGSRSTWHRKECYEKVFCALQRA